MGRKAEPGASEERKFGAPTDHTRRLLGFGISCTQYALRWAGTVCRASSHFPQARQGWGGGGVAYDRMRRKIRVLVGEDDADAARMVTVDFGRASLNAIAALMPEAMIACRYCHLGQSAYRRVHRLGIQGCYETKDDFRLRVKMLSALSFSPKGDMASAFDDLSPQFSDGEKPKLQ